MDLQAYKDAIERLAATKSDLEFPNSSVEHASIVVEALIKYADSEVRIYDDSISGDLDINSAISNQFKTIVNAGKQLKVVVRHHVKNDSNIYKTLKDLSVSHPKQVEVRIASSKFTTSVKNELGNDLNFATGDKSAYRLENLEKKADGKIIRTAQGSFNRPEKTKKLVQIFDENFASCNAYQF
ncbi:MAG TPA: hypothetical protein VK498_01860 [Ferruginibacter sp.]|nr:hypothetical protein [Ferruginibacter sp.]